ncbi:tRNA methyltransferase tyw3 [Gamsiella multidivaricata]|nr:tRNA methyltransferase tyw3 [Gamsiella multidivaricata]
MTVPVVLAPANLTKSLKIILDNTGHRDKTRLIARYNRVLSTQTGSDPQGKATLDQDGYDLSSYMAMALLPIDIHLQLQSNGDTQRISLWQILQDPASSPLSSLEWPAPISDPTIQKSIFLTWMQSSAFTMPKHLLTQTPLENLQHNIATFLLPFLRSWASSSNSDAGDQDQDLLSPDTLPQLIASIPQKWEHYSDFTLLPSNAFLIAPWPTVLKCLVLLDRAQGYKNNFMQQWDQLIQEALHSTHIARKAAIPVQDILRRPKIRPLTGDWGLHNRYKSWIEHDLTLLEHQHIPTTESANGHDDTILTHEQDTTSLTRSNISQTYWSGTCQNHVHYRWSPMFTMFSAGNITEKERIANSKSIFDARDKVVVDLYAGIGYFSLVYLVHAGAKIVHACEWNPWSVEGLLQGADRNHISWKAYQGPAVARSLYSSSSTPQELEQQPPFREKDHPQPTPGKKPKNFGKLIVYPGDNAQWITFFENQAHHVNLGLIPSAEPGWVLGVRALCSNEGGYLHIHHNIRVGEEETFKTYLLQSLRELFAQWKRCEPWSSSSPSSPGTNADCYRPWSIDIRHMENVKSFAPLVFHYVLDIECRPPSHGVTDASCISA